MQKRNKFIHLLRVSCFWIIATFFYPSTSLCQNSGSYLASIGCSAVIPLGALERNYNQTRPGVQLNFLKQIGTNKPIFAGLGIDYHSLGRRTATLEELLEFEWVEFKYTTTSNVAGLFGTCRYYLPVYFLPLEMYLEGNFGIRTSFTNTEKTLASDDELSDVLTEDAEIAPMYGIGTGWNFQLAKNVYIHLNGQYHWSKSMSYFIPDKNAVIQSSSLDLFKIRQSSMEHLMLGLGITFKMEANK